MPEYAGGLRAKLIRENFHQMVRTAMTDLGWFSSTLQAKEVVLLQEPMNPNNKILPNVLAITNEDTSSSEMELGSTLEENRWSTYVDIFAEDESIGVHLSGDVYDILRGKIAGRTDSSFRVYDYTLPEQPLLFYCELENIEIARVREWDKPFNQFWWVVACEIVDCYTGAGS